MVQYKFYASKLFVLLWIALSITPFLGLFTTFNLSELGGIFNRGHLLILLKSILLSASAAILAGVVGTLLAFFVAYVQRTRVQLTILLFSLPLFIPSYIHGIGWGRLVQGNSFLTGLLGLDPAGIVNGWVLSAWVLAMSYFPIVFLIVVLFCFKWSQQYQDAVLLHAPSKTAMLQQLRFIRQPLLISIIIVFFLSFADFGVADFFQIRVYSTEIFIQMSAFYDLPKAIWLSLPVIFLGMMLLYLIMRMSRHVSLASLMSFPSMTLKLDSQSTRYLWLVVILFMTVLLLPIMNLIHLAATVDNFMNAARIAAMDMLAGASLAGLVALISVITAFLLGWIHQRSITRLSATLRKFLYIWLLFPGGLLGLGLIQFWNQEGVSGWLYQAGMILGLGLVLRWLIVAFEIFSIGWKSIPVVQGQAVFVSGGNKWNAFIDVVLPQQWQHIIFAFLLTFILVYNEIAMLVLLSPPGFSSMPLRIFSAVHYGSDALLAAMCILQLGFLLMVFGGISWVSRMILYRFNVRVLHAGR